MFTQGVLAYQTYIKKEIQMKFNNSQFTALTILVVIINLSACSSTSGNRSISGLSSHTEATQVITKGMSMNDVETKLEHPLFKQTIDNEVTKLYGIFLTKR